MLVHKTNIHTNTHTPVNISEVDFNGQRVFGQVEVLQSMLLTGSSTSHMTAQKTCLHMR